MNENAREIRVAIGLIRRGDSILVGKRGTSGHLPGLSEFPGGKCGPEESFEHCVVRECLEETGLKVRILQERAQVVYNYEYGTVRLAFFDCELVTDGQPSGGFDWVAICDLRQSDFPEANATMITDLIAE